MPFSQSIQHSAYATRCKQELFVVDEVFVIDASPVEIHHRRQLSFFPSFRLACGLVMAADLVM